MNTTEPTHLALPPRPAVDRPTKPTVGRSTAAIDEAFAAVADAGRRLDAMHSRQKHDGAGLADMLKSQLASLEHQHAELSRLLTGLDD